MKCIDKSHYPYSLDPHLWSHFSNYEEFEHIPTNTNFNFIYSIVRPSIFDYYDNIVINWYDEPNCLVVDGLHETIVNNDSKIHKILTPCKYSVECYNKMYATDKWTQVFYPFNMAYLPKENRKEYDVYYTGNIRSPVNFAYPIIEKYNHCFVCSNYGNHRGVSYSEKIELNSKSKISITHGIMEWPKKFNYIGEKYPLHKGFDLLKSHAVVPQFKTRNLEAAAAKSLILCMKDPWNEIEEYFTPDIDFLYWTNAEDLDEKIKYILAHYDEFLPMIDRAHNKLINNFTTKHYFDKFLKQL